MTLQEKIGIKKIGNTSTSKGCSKRAEDIRRLVKRAKLSDEKRRALLKQASWYAWKSKVLAKEEKRSKKKAA